MVCLVRGWSVIIAPTALRFPNMLLFLLTSFCLPASKSCPYTTRQTRDEFPCSCADAISEISGNFNDVISVLSGYWNFATTYNKHSRFFFIGTIREVNTILINCYIPQYVLKLTSDDLGFKQSRRPRQQKSYRTLRENKYHNTN